MSDAPPSIQTVPPVIRHRVLQVHDFLQPAEVTWLTHRIFELESQFQPSGVFDRNADYRRSLVLNPPHDVSSFMVTRVKVLVPDAMVEVRVPTFDIGLIECQVTANNDGSYFRVHTDAGRN